MRSPNDIFCLIGKRGAGKDELAPHLGLPITSTSKVLSAYCDKEGIIPDRNTFIELGNTIFDGKTLAAHLEKDIPYGGVITGLRKPETLYHLLQQNRCLLIGILADDMTRRKRVTHRNRAGDSMPFLNFIDHEQQENSPPNKQNIDLLLAFADIHITNITSIDELITKGKYALQKVLTRKNSKTHIDAQGYQHFSRAILINEDNEILLLYDANKMLYTLPGGKVDSGETPDITIQRELLEEINISPSATYCGSFPGLFKDGLGKGHFFTGKVAKQDISILEPMTHTKHIRVPKDKLEETIGYVNFVDSGLYHYINNTRIKDWDLTREYSLDAINSNMLIQYIDTNTSKAHIVPRMTKEGVSAPNHIPIRITSVEAVYQGFSEQCKRFLHHA